MIKDTLIVMGVIWSLMMLGAGSLILGIHIASKVFA